MKKILLLFFLLLNILTYAEDGYRLWLRYDKINNKALLSVYKSRIGSFTITGTSPVLTAAKTELEEGLSGLLGIPVKASSSFAKKTLLTIGTASSLGLDYSIADKIELRSLGGEGFIISSSKMGPGKIVITANTDIGVLYGVFHFLRLLQTQQSITNLNIASVPKLKLRMLNHWDNLNRTVERGYAGFSIWDWHRLPGYIDPRYIDYARANASIGINAVSLTNVGANALSLTALYLEKAKALADVFRPYGIKIYLTAKFSAPVEIGGLKTADPLNDSVRAWWKNKADEIYALIPDFGGFLVKANSEGQPGPQDYKRTHADGANMLADAMAPHSGIVIWRAFVYAAENPVDRHMQAYNNFVPLDGTFRSNVMVQAKNGAIDFMPREPFHPLFGSMPKTPLVLEVQLTQEYTGQATQLVFLAPMYKETLESDTYSKGKGSTVAKVIDGSMDNHTLSGMAGVANIGTDINWCGHPFAQANWYALGRLEWDYSITSNQIADEWLRMTFTNDTAFVNDTKKIMLSSREILVNYMNPIGLHHIMATGHHYGPGPWVNNLSRPEWNPVYYHKADSAGLGFNRTITGSNALSQYKPEVQKAWEDVKTVDDKLLLWFHHVPWDFTMKSGRTMWNELCYKYYTGTDSVAWMQQVWNKQAGKIDTQRFTQVRLLLKIQQEEALWWRNACLLYFQTFSRQPIPAEFEQPDRTLEYYKSLKFPYAPGNPPFSL